MQQSQEKIARLEQEKEHWLLEAQLGRVRLEKESRRITELEARLSSACDDRVTSPTQSDSVSPGHAELDTEDKADNSHSTSLVSYAFEFIFWLHLYFLLNSSPNLEVFNYQIAFLHPIFGCSPPD